MRIPKTHLILAVVAALAVSSSAPLAGRTLPPADLQAPAVTSPMQEWGHNIGDDYFLVNYQQASAYFRKLDQQSDRMQLVEIGRTALDRPQLMAMITAPANFARLDRYKEISARLSRAEGLTEDQARAWVKAANLKFGD